MKLFIASLVTVLVSLSAAQHNPNCKDDRRVIVHLFEMRWIDIAAECERFLSPRGYCGVQVSPVNEHSVVMNPVEKRPWSERYQPVSYKIYSRSGDESAFIDMVRRCNNVGVNIYVDGVFNHMMGTGFGKGVGIAGTPFDVGTLSFPGVPYTADDFNSKTSHPSVCTSASGEIENWNDPSQIRNCRLFSLVDLSQGKPNVQTKILDFMNRLVRIGVAGFRIDVAKHMWPADLQQIFPRVENLNTQWFPANTRPFICQEVSDYGGEAIKSSEYYSLGRVIEFNYGKYVTEAFRGFKQIKNFKYFGEGYGYLMPDNNALVFIDNHDTQRGHGQGGNVATFFESRLYKMCVTYMLAWPYGVASVMSSYMWERNFVNGEDKNDWVGPPSDSNYNTKPVIINSDLTCDNGWVCEHRWRQIVNMVKFRNVAGWNPVENWWDDGDNQIAFSRGNKAFYIINSSTWKSLDETLYTGLPEGRYCDVISGSILPDKRSCSGLTIWVGGDGKARFVISAKIEDPMMAIHVESKLE